MYDYTTQKPKKRINIGFLIFVGIALAPIVAGGILNWNAFRAQSWPSTDGIIVVSEETTVTNRTNAPDSVTGRPGTTTEEKGSRIKYEFEVDGETYESYTVAKGMDSGGDADYWLGRFPKGKEVTVYYNPRKPSDSILIPYPLSPTGVYAMVGGGMMLLISLLVFGLTGSIMVEKKKKPTHMG